MTRVVRIRRPGALTFVVGLATAAWTAGFSATAFGWISAHSEISRAAWKVQPQALQDLWSKPFRLPNGKESSRPISEYLISRWSGAPDSAASRKSRDEFLYYEGDWLYHYFVFSPEENRGRAERGARWYFEHIIAAFREGRSADAARYAGGFAHALEDRSCPVHAYDGYAQERELLESQYADRGLQDSDKSFRGDALSYSAVWFVDDQDVKVSIAGYQPKPLGDTPEKAAIEVARRLQTISDYTRKICSQDSNVPGTFLNEHLKDKWYGPSYFHQCGPATVALLEKMARQSAYLVADVFLTSYRLSGPAKSLGRNRIESRELAVERRERLDPVKYVLKTRSE